MRIKLSHLILSISFISSLLLNFYLYKRFSILNLQNQVVKVIDGDTFITKSNQKIRLLGTDSPELGHCGSNEAQKSLENLVLNKVIRLESQFNDKYGRTIALVFLNNTFINEILVREGWARFDGAKNSKSDVLKEASLFAQKEKKGVFSSLCRKEVPENPNCLIKGNVDKISGVKRFHFPGCREYNTTIVEKDLGESWFCTEKQAEAAGFQKSQNCYGKKFIPG